MSEKSIFGWHFTSDKLRDGMPIPPVGEWLVHKGPIVPCMSGLHMSEHPFDALQYAPGNVIHFVELSGQLAPHGDPIDKYVGRKRRILASKDITKELFAFARSQALSVIHLWEAPPVVKEYLETGNDELRLAAKDAAWAARDAAGLASSMAAGLAASLAAGAAWDAAAAAARKAAAAAARNAARKEFHDLILNLPEFSQAKGMYDGRIPQS